MPWSQVTPMDEKRLLIEDVCRGRLTITELCARHNISRKTAYKWIDRHAQEGLPGLEDRSRVPLSCPHKTPPELEAQIIQARQRHPTWGPKKLLGILGDDQPDAPWPALSTVSEILKRNGLVKPPRHRFKPGHPGKPAAESDAPNELWAVDFKGHFRTGDGIYCYPLTITDNFSRMILACHGLYTTACADAKVIFRRVFQEYGLPVRIRSDNGVPFATTALARLSDLSAWWIRLGILPELIEPGRPQQNGKHERMHRTLKAETARPPASSLRSQQRRFDSFRKEFNHERPHEALDQKRPGALYTTSPRPYPSRIPPLEYPAHFEKRYVSANGGIRWSNRWINVSTCCVGEYVGLEEVDNGAWDVYFGHLRIGRLLEEHLRIEDRYGKLIRRH